MSIRNTVTKKLFQGDAMCYFLGFMIGIGGFAEATLVGMGIYTLVVVTRPLKEQSLLASWSKDIAAVAIGFLLLVYWSYIDPHSLSICKL